MLIYFAHVISDLEMKKIIRNNFVDHIITRCAVFIYLESTTNKVLELSHFAYACKTEGKNDISRLISETA